MSESEGRRYRLRGRVQGVGFRHFTRVTARRLGLDGWVRNEPDGTVTLEVGGDPEGLDRLEEELRSGPRAARVDDLETEELPGPPGVDGFDVRY